MGAGENNTTFTARFLGDPVGFVKRGIYKMVIGPLKYKQAEGYDATRYWKDRFSKYGTSLLGPGDEGMSEAQNERMYRDAEQQFLEACRGEGIDFPKARVLEIGVGNGFYAGLLHRSGVSAYLGADIADVLFPEFRERFPGFRFARVDITADPIEGEFDAIFVIDVVQHIVTEKQFAAAIANVAARLAPGGVFILGPLVKVSAGGAYFYMHAWAVEDVLPHLPAGLVVGGPYPFRSGKIFAFRKPA